MSKEARIKRGKLTLQVDDGPTEYRKQYLPESPYAREMGQIVNLNIASSSVSNQLYT